MVAQKSCQGCSRIYDFNLVRDVADDDGDVWRYCPFCYTDYVVNKRNEKN